MFAVILLKSLSNKCLSRCLFIKCYCEIECHICGDYADVFYEQRESRSYFEAGIICCCLTNALHNAKKYQVCTGCDKSA